MNACLLGVDIGTSACKATLFTVHGRVVAQSASEYAVSYPCAGQAEQDPDLWWKAACDAIRLVLERGGVNASNIYGVGVDGQSWSAVAVDKRGNALAPTPIWTDTRAQEECGEARALVPESELFALCGNPLKPGYTLPKALWYKRHMPDVYANAAFILQSNGFLVHRLTGAFTHDISQGYGWHCFDMRRGEWNTDMCRRLGLRASLLPPIRACHEVVGAVTREAALLTGLTAGTPVVAGGLDAACATLGAGVCQTGQAQEQGGQAGGMSLCVDKYVADPRLILSAHVVPEKWLLQGGTTGGGGALKWLRGILGADVSFESMSALADEVPAGSDGVVFLPYMAGERSPLWNPDARGVFYGLDYGKTRAHLVRAVMEGVAYALRHNLETAREVGAEADSLRAVGGSANSLVWTQIKADVTGRRMEVPASDTAATWGAAMLAGVGTGALEGFASAARDTVTVMRVHEPNPALRDVYEKGYSAYRELYQRLEPMMKEREQA